ncbi:MAG TPA: fumarylacetoacetate hydrolase family protein [Pseudonocardia sp.]
MRLFRTSRGLAVADGDELALLDLPHPDLAAVFRDDPAAIDRASVTGRIPLADATLLAPVARPGKIVIAGANYRDHVLEAGLPMPSAPVFLIAESASVTGPGAPIVLPAECPDQVDYEGELAVVVGRAGRHIPAGQAWRYLAGITVANDVSARDLQLASMPGGRLVDLDGVRRAKTFPGFKPIGPCLVTLDDEVGPLDLAIRTTVNGEVRQQGRTGEMLFGVPAIVEYVSARVGLEIGDVILTGTPSGVALASGKYLRPGDTVTVEIDGIGALPNTVVLAP